jgi:dUTP pyrophosphatase
MKIKIINKSKHQLPEYATEASAGMDLRANLEDDIILKPIERIMVTTGLFHEIPVCYEAQIRSRSGLAIKKGVTILNSPGTIDADCRGEVCIILVNLSNENFVIEDGERISQMIISRHEKAERESVNILLNSDRGNGGFKHTGKK